MISTYFGQFFSGGVDPSVPHLVLILAAVIGGLAVGIGIIWESARDGHLWALPTALVLIGVVTEAAATVVLFEFDEGISRAQQSAIRVQNTKIVQLETRLAQRRVDGDSFLAELKQYPAWNVEIKYVVSDADSYTLALQLQELFGELQWNAAIDPIAANDNWGSEPEGTPGSMIAPPFGITLFWHIGTVALAEISAAMNGVGDVLKHEPQPFPPSPNTRFVVLSNLLSKSLGVINFNNDHSGTLDKYTLRIVIGPKQ